MIAFILLGEDTQNFLVAGFNKASKSAGLSPDANAAVFHCADEYITALQVSDLLSGNALMAYALNGKRVDRFGYPLRLAAPGMYGYKWAKWLIRIELVEDFPKGYWEKKGLPRRGKIGDVW